MNETPGPWWDQAPDSVAAAIWREITRKDEMRRWRLEAVRDLVAMLERDLWRGSGPGLRQTGDGPPTWASSGSADMPEEAVSYNQALTDCWAIANQITRELPDLVISPSNLRYEEQQRTRAMSSALAATMNRDKATIEQQGYYEWGLWYGFGAAFPRVQDGMVRYKSVREYELVYDYASAIDGEPECLHYWTRMSKQAVLGMVEAWDESSSKMMDAIRKLNGDSWWLTSPLLDGAETPYQERIHENSEGREASLLVSWSWRLPYRSARKGESDAEIKKLGGRAVVVVHDGAEHGQSLLISDKPMTRRRTPIAMWAPFQSYEGIFSMGLAGMLKAMQIQRDRLMSGLYEDIVKLHRTKIAVEDGVQEQAVTALRSGGVDVIKVPRGTLGREKPYEMIPGNPQSPQALAWLDKIDYLSAKYVGSNEALQQGMTTGGGANESGRAKLVDDDRMANRFASIEARLLVARQELGIRTLDCLDDQAERDKEFRVQLRGPESEAYRWSDIALPREEYHVEVEQKGVLAKRLPGRIQQLMEMAQNGAVPPEDALAEIAESADLRRVTEQSQAGRRLIQWQIAGLSQMGKSREYYAERMPVPKQDHGMGIAMATAEYQSAVRKQASQKVIDRLLSYIDACNTEIKKAEQTAPTPAPQPMPGPEGMPPEMAGAAPMDPMAAGPVPAAIPGEIPMV